VAKMGARTMIKSKKRVAEPTPLVLIPATTINLTANSVVINPVAPFHVAPMPDSLGLPIMREGFVTDTGFLPNSGA
jgi:hypothetical protein